MSASLMSCVIADDTGIRDPPTARGLPQRTGVQAWRESVLQRSHRRRWCQNGCTALPGNRFVPAPCVKGKPQQSAAVNELRIAVFSDDHGAVRQFVEASLPYQAIAGPNQAAPPGQALGIQAPVELRCEQRPRCACRPRNGVSVCAIIVAAAQRTRSMARGERNGIIEKEQRCPPAWPRERPAPAAEFRPARDPHGAAVMPHDPLFVVDHAATVAREHSARRDRVQVAPGIDAVTAWHGWRQNPVAGCCSPELVAHESGHV